MLNLRRTYPLNRSQIEVDIELNKHQRCLVELSSSLKLKRCSDNRGKPIRLLIRLTNTAIHLKTYKLTALIVNF